MRPALAALLCLCAAAPAAALPCPDWAAGCAASVSDFSPPLTGGPAFEAGGCPKASQPEPEQPAVREVSEVPADLLPLPADDLDRAGLLEALRTSLDHWNSRPDSARINIGKDSFDAPRLRRTMTALLDIFSAEIPDQELLKILKDRFRVYRASADDGTGKTVITGYYEAELAVTRRRDEAHRYPVYLKPADLIKTTPEMGVDFDYGRYQDGRLVPYYETAEIQAGALAGRGLELAWTEHPSRLMLLQIQGSGVLRLSDGDYFRAGFDGANGRPFRSVQRALMDCGELPAMSFKDFIAYLSSQPADREERLIAINPRYIFFKERPKDSPPYGAIGRALTAGRSIAIDPKHIPLGLFGLLKSRRPAAQEGGLAFKDFARFIATHDTGSAIRGPGRVDLFWGTGAQAETEASSMKAPGELYLLIIR